MTPFLGRGVAALAAMAVAAVSLGTPAQAASQVFTVSTDQCTGPGSYTEAVQLANQNPGLDRIDFQSDVNFASCAPPTFPYTAATATESVELIGNGHTVKGVQTWVSRDGTVNEAGTCPANVSSAIIADYTPGLISVGTYNADNTGIKVDIIGLKLKDLASIAWVQKNSELYMGGTTAEGIRDILGSCNRMPIQVEVNANVTIEESQIRSTDTAGVLSVDPDQVLGAVVMNNPAGPSNLNIINSVFSRNNSGNAIQWAGDVNIVSSQFQSSGGLEHRSGTAQIVNSAWSTGFDSNKARNRITARPGSDMKIAASTAHWADPI